MLSDLHRHTSATVLGWCTVMHIIRIVNLLYDAPRDLPICVQKGENYKEMAFWYNRCRDLYSLLTYIAVRMSAKPLYTNW